MLVLSVYFCFFGGTGYSRVALKILAGNALEIIWRVCRFTEIPFFERKLGSFEDCLFVLMEAK